MTILADILRALSMARHLNKMAIVYRTNLNFQRIGRYLDLLITAGHVVTVNSGRNSEAYCITEKGREFIVRYDRLVGSLRSPAMIEGAALDNQVLLPAT